MSKKLISGNTIKVIAPSSSGATMKKSVIKTAEKRLGKLGFNIEFSKHVFEKDIIDSSSIKSKISDLHEALTNKKVHGISCVRGGYSINTLLPYIKFELFKQNPKPIIGYSDITVLLNAIYAKTGLVSYLGPNFSTFGQKDQKGSTLYNEEYFKKCVINNEPYEIIPSTYFSERKVSPKKNIGPVVIQNGNATGIIIGGNLCSLNLLQGTKYMPSLKDKILFIEEDDFGGEYTPHEFERNLESLLQLPDVIFIKGIVFGRFQTGSKMTIQKLKHILSSKRISRKIPIIANIDFGHTMPLATIPIGGEAKIEATKSKTKITIIKH